MNILNMVAAIVWLINGIIGTFYGQDLIEIVKSFLLSAVFLEIYFLREE